MINPSSSFRLWIFRRRPRNNWIAFRTDSLDNPGFLARSIELPLIPLSNRPAAQELRCFEELLDELSGFELFCIAQELLEPFLAVFLSTGPGSFKNAVGVKEELIAASKWNGHIRVSCVRKIGR